MKNLSTVFFPLALVALLAALTFWLERAANPEDPARKAQLRHDPDYVIDHFDVRHFDASGALKQALVAESMTHYPDDDSTEIARPQLTYYVDGSTTQLLANTAQISKDNKQVFLRGNVRLIKPQADRPAKVLNTEALTVFPDDDLATGNSRATITHGESVISGDSILYNGKTSVSVLSGRVKGIFYRVKKS